MVPNPKKGMIPEWLWQSNTSQKKGKLRGKERGISRSNKKIKKSHFG